MNNVNSPETRRWRLHDLIVDGPSLQIHQGGRVLSTEPTQVASLLALIEAWPEIVDKNTLIEKVWGQPVVSDSAVHKTISLLRQQLREAGADRLIETRHRLGYRLTEEPQAIIEPNGTAPSDDPSSSKPSSVAAPRPKLWAAVTVMLLGLLWWFWPAESPSEAPPDIVETGPSTAQDPSDVLAERDFDELVELARASMPDDLELAKQALAHAADRIDQQTGDERPATIEKYLGILHFYRAEHQRAIEHWNRALAGFERSDNQIEIANVLTNLGASHEVRDAPPEQVAALYDRALAIRHALDDSVGLIRTLNNQATLWIAHGRIEPALQAVAKLTEVANTLEDARWQVRANLLAGEIDALQAGVDAVPAFMSAHDLAVRSGRIEDAAIAAQRLARTFGERSELATQREWLERARRHVENAGLDAQLPIIDYAIGVNHERRGEPVAARLAYRAVLDGLPANESIHLAVDAEVALARLDFQAGRSDTARQRVEQALRKARIQDHRLAEASALLAGGFMDLSEPDGAAAAFRAVTTIRERLGGMPPFGIQRHLLRLEALALVASGRIDEALGVAGRLSELARSRQHRTAEQDSQLIEAIALFSSSRFDEGWRAHQLAHGRALVPLPSAEDSRAMVGEESVEQQRHSVPPVALSILLIGLAFFSGWLFSSRLRSDP